MSVREERTGVLVLTAWLEQQGTPLRVRITERTDLRSVEESSRLIVGAEATSSAVRDWLLTLESDAPQPSSPNDETRSR